MMDVKHFFSLNQQDLWLLDQAFIVLIPNKSCPDKVSDYRPISLTHSFAKLISIFLANRLGLELGNLVVANQTTFIKNRCIHDCFIYVKEMIKTLHEKKTPSLFIKLDILRLLIQSIGLSS
jgi:hypothetical protein